VAKIIERLLSAILAHSTEGTGGLPANLSFDSVKCSDVGDCFEVSRRGVNYLDIVKVAPCTNLVGNVVDGPVARKMKELDARVGIRRTFQTFKVSVRSSPLASQRA
jgi:hypothetical protein